MLRQNYQNMTYHHITMPYLDVEVCYQGLFVLESLQAYKPQIAVAILDL